MTVKFKSFIALASSGMLASIASAANEQQPSPADRADTVPPHHRQHMLSPTDLMAMYDLNKDGVLDENEVAAMHKDFLAHRAKARRPHGHHEGFAANHEDKAVPPHHQKGPRDRRQARMAQGGCCCQ